jgi:hypothetical protein
MMGKYISILCLILLGMLTGTQSAFGGAWTQSKKGYYFKFSLNNYLALSSLDKNSR